MNTEFTGSVSDSVERLVRYPLILGKEVGTLFHVGGFVLGSCMPNRSPVTLCVLPVKLRKSKLWGMERISVFYGGNAAMVVSVVPRQPILGISEHFMRMPLKGHEVIERVDLGHSTGLDEAHEEIAYVCPVQGAVKEAVFTMPDCHFQGSFGNIVVQGISFALLKTESRAPSA